jgi:hypothetical protein
MYLTTPRSVFNPAGFTHGLANGLERFRAEMPLLERPGAENLREDVPGPGWLSSRPSRSRSRRNP